MLSYAGVCSLWIPLLAWMMPSHSFRVGMMYLMRGDWTFEVRLRSGECHAAAACCHLGRSQPPFPGLDTAAVPVSLQSLLANTDAPRRSRTLWQPRRCTRTTAQGRLAINSGGVTCRCGLNYMRASKLCRKHYRPCRKHYPLGFFREMWGEEAGMPGAAHSLAAGPANVLSSSGRQAGREGSVAFPVIATPPNADGQAL